MSEQFRIGEGWDTHALVPGRPLIIGGVTVPHSVGLLGHSDADVLIHAIIDALLGAAGLGDIGSHFPDTDVRFKGADSVLLLRETGRLLAERGLRIGNIDSTVIAQAPKLASHIPAMRERIAAMRRALHDRLSALVPDRDVGYFLTQRGMFSYTGLSAAQVDQLREQHAVYLIRSGRICVAGLNTGNVERTAEAMAAVLRG